MLATSVRSSNGDKLGLTDDSNGDHGLQWVRGWVGERRCSAALFGIG